MIENVTSTEFWDNVLDLLVRWSLETLPTIVLILIIYFLVKRLLQSILMRFKNRLKKNYQESGDLEGEKRANTLTGLFNSIAGITLNTILVLILLSQIGINIGPLLAGAGILGLAIGFGSQELVRDVISGFFIILEDQIRIGDVVQINGTGGLVEKIEVRTITLRDFSGVVHVFQNGKINTLSNMTKTWSAMVFDIGVAYKENTDHVVSVIKQVGEDLIKDDNYKERILEPLEISGLDRFGSSEVVIRARLKTLPGNQWAIGREFRRRLKLAFDKEGIVIPFPHSTIYFGENDNSGGKEKFQENK